MTTEPITIKFAKSSPDAVIPRYAHNGDSGFDLHIVENVTLEPNERRRIKTGLMCELPHNYEIQVRPRSGISTNTKLVIILATIDSCYRGEIHIIAHNTATTPLFIPKGSSIAQGVVNRLPEIQIEEIDKTELTGTSRGNNGFGSTSPIIDITSPEPAFMNSDLFKQLLPEHADNCLVQFTNEVIAAKLAKSRTKGRGGWNTEKCTNKELWKSMYEHIGKGDPVDIIIFAAMIHARSTFLQESA